MKKKERKNYLTCKRQTIKETKKIKRRLFVNKRKRINIDKRLKQ